MVVRGFAAPPTPWSKKLAQPQIHQTAYVHSFSNIIGDVRIGPNVLVAPGASIRADEGTPFFISEGTNIQDGVVIHGLEQGRVVGDDQDPYSVWIGKNASITHMALIHGPAYIGDDCFIGFRSTVFNARVGQGCIVMMHALIQDVEIPPGKYVPSGTMVTSQQQADRLPDVQASDIQFAHHVVRVNDALRSGYHCAEDDNCIIPIRNETDKPYKPNRSNGGRQMQSSQLNSEVIQQVQQLLAQGYRIGTEHVSKRRFQTGSWQSCAPIDARYESEVVAALEDCLANHGGEYVRLFGIDPKSKQRASELIIQRPGDPTVSSDNRTRTTGRRSDTSTSNYSGSGNGQSTSLSSEVQAQIRQLIAQGHRVGVEHVNKRRFRTGSWQSCGAIQTKQESEVIRTVEDYLREYDGEYLRLIGINPKSKQRVLEQIIQRPDGQTSGNSSGTATSSSRSSRSNGGGQMQSSQVNSEVIQQVQQLLAQGYRIGTEHVSKRRFQTGSWQSCAPIDARRESEVVAALEDCLANHSGEYVRLFGIDPKSKQRASELIIQRPGDPTVSSDNRSRTTGRRSDTSTSNYSGSGNGQSTSLSSEVQAQIRQLIAQGHRVGVEHVNKRRFRTGSWQSCGAIQTKQESEVIRTVEDYLREYDGEYLRLIGINPKSKQRVLEQIIQRPDGQGS